MAGNVPPSVRFINLRGVLSSSSIQALCLLLKRGNVAFADYDDSSISSSSLTSPLQSPSSSTQNMGVALGFKNSQSMSPATSAYDMVSKVNHNNNNSHQESSSAQSPRSFPAVPSTPVGLRAGVAAGTGPITAAGVTTATINGSRSTLTDDAASGSTNNSGSGTPNTPNAHNATTPHGPISLTVTHNNINSNNYNYNSNSHNSSPETEFKKQQSYSSSSSSSSYVAGQFNAHFRNPLRPSKGLLGLAITHTTFTSADIKHLVDLLAVYASSRFMKVVKSGSSGSSGSSSSGSSNNSLSGNNLTGRRRSGVMIGGGYSSNSNNNSEESLNSSFFGPHPRGIRYLDVSSNKFGDTVCAEILNAAGMGPLEGLDLSSNNIQKGKDFIEVLAKITPSVNVSFLRHLGLSNNSLANKAVCQILECIQESQIITSLDLSYNNIVHSKQLETTLRDFLKFNNSLRILDLGFNRLNQDSITAIYLGLIENETLLLLPLVHNTEAAAKATEISFIQSKLMDNRKRYKVGLQRYNDMVQRYKSNIIKRNSANLNHIANLPVNNNVTMTAESIMTADVGRNGVTGSNNSGDNSLGYSDSGKGITHVSSVSNTPLTTARLDEHLLLSSNTASNSDNTPQKLIRNAVAAINIDDRDVLPIDAAVARSLEESSHNHTHLSVSGSSPFLTLDQLNSSSIGSSGTRVHSHSEDLAMEGRIRQNHIQTNISPSSNHKTMTTATTITLDVDCDAVLPNEGSAASTSALFDSTGTVSEVINDLDDTTVPVAVAVAVYSTHTLQLPLATVATTTAPAVVIPLAGAESSGSVSGAVSDESSNRNSVVRTDSSRTDTTATTASAADQHNTLATSTSSTTSSSYPMINHSLSLELPPATPISTSNSISTSDSSASVGGSTGISSVSESSERDSDASGANSATTTATTTLALSSKGTRPTLPRTNSGTSDTPALNVFFSAPLVWRDRAGKYHPLEMLDYKSERDSLVQVLTEVHRDISICFQFATTDSLRTALSFGCRALHFSGHGHPQFLNFEDGRGGLQPVSVETLRGLLRAGGLKLDFVFVSACHSRKTGEAFVEAGVPHVVCVKVDAMIQDSAANAFTRAFYLALFTGKTVQASFDIARHALKSAPYVPDSVLEGEKFILLPETPSFRDSVDTSRGGRIITTAGATVNSANMMPAGHHDRSIFRSRTVSVWPSFDHIRMGSGGFNAVNNVDKNNMMSSNGRPSNSSSMNTINSSSQSSSGSNTAVVLYPPTINRYFDGVSGSSGTFFGSCNSSLPSPPPDFEGREVDMHRIISTLLYRRLVSLVGSSGVGKTAITTSLCTYVSDRRLFPDGVFYLRVSGVVTYTTFLEKLLKGLLGGPPKVSERLQAIRATSQAFIQATASLIPSPSLTSNSGMLNSNSSNASHSHSHHNLGQLARSNSDAVDILSTSGSLSMNNNGGVSNGNSSSNSGGGNINEIIFNREELIVTSLNSLHVLLVFDHLDDLLQGKEESGTDLKFFLGRLFDRCQQVKVLVTSVDSLGMSNVSGFGVIEHCISLGTLTLRSSIRLYARLAPSLLTSAAKQDFIAALLPTNSKQHHVTFSSREITKASAEILALFGNGHPADIVKLACVSTQQSVEFLMQQGLHILSQQHGSILPITMHSQSSLSQLQAGIVDIGSPLSTQSQVLTQNQNLGSLSVGGGLLPLGSENITLLPFPHSTSFSTTGTETTQSPSSYVFEDTSSNNNY